MTASTAPSEIQFVSPAVITTKAKYLEIGNISIEAGASVAVVGGEYKDEPDLIVEVVHAIDPDGNDVSERVIRRIAVLLAGA